MIQRLGDWAHGRPSRPALLIRAALNAAEPDDAALRLVLVSELDARPVEPHLAALAWRAIELMDLGPPNEEQLDAVAAMLEDGAPAPTPLTLPNGARIDDPDTARIAATALALRALSKGGRGNETDVRRRLDDLARMGPGFEGVTRRASALHGIAAEAVHYPTQVEKLVAELGRAQSRDGSWGADDLFHVAQALLAVDHPDATKVLWQGRHALEKEQRADGGFGSEERSWIACRWLVRVGA